MQSLRNKRQRTKKFRRPFAHRRSPAKAVGRGGGRRGADEPEQSPFLQSLGHKMRIKNGKMRGVTRQLPQPPFQPKKTVI